MATTTIPLHDLAQRIQQQEAELAKLRKEHESRQVQLAQLTRRRGELQAQLEKIEAEIQTVGPGGAPERVSPAATPKAKPALGRRAGGISFPQFLADIVGEVKRPITTRELTEEVVRRKFPTTSTNIQAMVETRVYDLIRKGVLRRSGSQKGVIPGKAFVAGKPAAAKAPSMPAKKAVAAKPAASSKAKADGKKQTLHDALTRVLAKSSRPLNTQELADQALADGYQTKSKDLKNVIWVGISKMKNIERIPGKGYRLKKGK
jgi:hypothetical protein